MIGQILDERYRVDRLLGEGGTGEVYLVEHLHLERFEALKVLKPELARDPEFAARFRREARAAHRVAHPHIVGAHDFGRLADGRMYLAMEYAAGPSLQEVLAGGGPMPVARILRLVGQLARAIDHAHSRGVIHRDLKPANIVITERRGEPDFVKVLDFGVAKVIAPDFRDSLATGKSAVHGTPHYMAPEQARGKGTDPRIDIYAAGCLAFEMVTGRPPFRGKLVEVLVAHVQKAPPRPSELVEDPIPPELEDVILRCLEKDPDKRFQSGGELDAALRRVPGYRSGLTQKRPRITISQPEASPPEEGFFDDRTELSPGHAAPAAAELREGRAEVAGALAAALLEAGSRDPFLILGLADLRETEADLERIDDEFQAIVSRAEEAERRANEREAVVRFALAELRFDQVSNDSVRARAAEMEERLPSIASDLERTLAALGDREIALATERAERDERREIALHTLEAVVVRCAPPLRYHPSVERLWRELAEIRGG